MDKEYLSGVFEIGWHIRHFSQSKQQIGKAFKSPHWVDDGPWGTRWYLTLHLWGRDDSDYVGIYLNKDDDESDGVQIPIRFSIELKAANVCLQKRRVSVKSIFEGNAIWGFDRFIKLNSLLEGMESILSHDDTLSVYCKINQKGDADYATETMMKMAKLEFNWAIPNWSKLSPTSKVYSNILFVGECKASFQLSISTTDDTDKNLLFIVTKVDPNKDGLLICRVSLLDTHDCEVLLQETRHRFSDELDTTSDILFPGEQIHDCNLKDDSLLLRFVLGMVTSTIPRIEHTSPDDRKEEEKILTECYVCLYRHCILCDVKARAGGKIVKCHRHILCKKSAVVRNKPVKVDKKHDGYLIIDFDDLDGDTLQKMIDFMYYDELEDMDYKSSMKLFAAGHKYQIECLKDKCSAVLRTYFTLENIFDILVAAQNYEDGNLKGCVIIYFTTNFSYISLTPEWENFKKTEKVLAEQLSQIIQQVRNV